MSENKEYVGKRLRTDEVESKTPKFLQRLKEATYVPKHLFRGSYGKHMAKRNLAILAEGLAAAMALVLVMILIIAVFTSVSSAIGTDKLLEYREGTTGARLTESQLEKYNNDTKQAMWDSEAEKVAIEKIAETISEMNKRNKELEDKGNEEDVLGEIEAEPVEEVDDTVEEVEDTENGHKFLLDCAEPDENYVGVVVPLSDEDRRILTCMIEGEDNQHGFEGAALVAQAIRDALLTDGYKNINAVRVGMQYDGYNKNKVSQSTLDAIDWVFDQGNSAVQHRIMYFYSKNSGKVSRFHESQNFVLEYGAHRFFDRWS